MCRLLKPNNLCIAIWYFVLKSCNGVLQVDECITDEYTKTVTKCLRLFIQFLDIYRTLNFTPRQQLFSYSDPILNQVQEAGISVRYFHGFPEA
jgi:hypothetical protein